MAENGNGRLFLKASDFVDVVDDEGNDLPPVPKHWGEEQLAPGAKRKGKGASRSTAASSTQKSGDPDQGNGQGKQDGDGPEEPAGNASTEAWVDYAKAKGAADSDLVDEKGEPLSRDALRDKFGTPKAS